MHTKHLPSNVVRKILMHVVSVAVVLGAVPGSGAYADCFESSSVGSRRPILKPCGLG
jgi:hypothetical protein